MVVHDRGLGLHVGLAHALAEEAAFAEDVAFAEADVGEAAHLDADAWTATGEIPTAHCRPRNSSSTIRCRGPKLVITYQ